MAKEKKVAKRNCNDVFVSKLLNWTKVAKKKWGNIYTSKLLKTALDCQRKENTGVVRKRFLSR